MDTLEAIRSRRSIRAYTERSVDRALVEAVILDAAQAPPPFSGMVPWTFNVLEGAEVIARHGDAAKQFAKDNHPDEPGWDWVNRADFQVFWGAPVVIVISGGLADCCRAGQNLMLSAHARGLGTCWVGAPMLWLRTPEAKRLLGVPADLTPVSALCLGYAAEVPAVAPRERPPIIWSNDQ